MLRQRQPRVHEADHLAWIRTLPCTICLDDTSTEAAHIRMGDRRAAKEHSGIGEKPHDRWTVPLCSECHRDQHQHNERDWWALHDRDPIMIALALHSVSGDHQAGECIIKAYR